MAKTSTSDEVKLQHEKENNRFINGRPKKILFETTI